MHRIHSLIRVFSGRPRLWTSVILGLITWFLLPEKISAHAGTRYLLAWNICALSYLGFAAHMMRISDADHMTHRAIKQSEGRFMVLAFAVLGAISVLVAITSQLGLIREAEYSLKIWRAGITILTVLSTWLFVHTLFAMHYAHDYYLARLNQLPLPLQFPGDTLPDYGDFLYAACIIGTSGQTADVAFSTRSMRRVCLFQCTFAFFFNTTILALTINIAASLF
jgi:uncharacterized membrane protein